ncbi:S8 family serine peptidase [Paenisporosarcina quisquiliarum]|uniref:S8 family peptidase n=1 Tax=Paenisporosarcina quisquiliarum TaxID=365346 RepID=UPI0037350CC2
MSHFQKVFLTLIFLILIANVSVVSAEDSQDQRVLITFNDQISEEVIEQVDGEINIEFDDIAVAAVSVSEKGIQELKKDPSIKRIEKDLVIKSNSQVLDWGIQSINITKTWQTGYTGKGVKVAVIDSGISSHEDLVIAGGVSFVDYTNSYQDDNGHGTHVAGIISASDNGYGVKGVASGVELYAVKTMDEKGSAYLSNVIAGVNWAIQNQMDIINLSLSTQSESPAFKDIVDKAYDEGILLVAAAGNDGTKSGDTVDFPARYPSVIAVGAIDQNNRFASFSSTGPDVEVVAPGVAVLSTYLNNSYARLNGTSMATPFVSGYLALLKQAYPSLSNYQLRSLLINHTLDLGLPGFDQFFGNGLVIASDLKLPLFGVPSTGNPAIDLKISNENIKLFPGESVELDAVVVLKDGTEINISNEAVWNSSENAIATVLEGKVDALRIGEGNISVSYGGLSTKIPIEVVEANPVSFVTPSISVIDGQIGDFIQVEMEATREDGSVENVTKESTWISEDNIIAEVIQGNIQLKSAGETYVKATYDNKTIEIKINVIEEIHLPDFSDVPSEFWAYKDINQLRDRHIILGYEDNTFKPHSSIRRDHVTVLLSKAIDLPSVLEAADFVDVQVTYRYYPEIKKAQLAGLVSGDLGKFNPQENLTRAQMAKVLVLAFDLKKKGEHSFVDVSKNHWASDYISILYSNGITIGDNGKYSPESPVTRAHFAAFLARSFEVQVEM